MPDHFYVYPAYLDRQSSRGLGRRVSASAAVDEVTAEQILAAARSLGFTAEIEPAKQYPRQYHTYAGRVKIAKKSGLTKTRALRELAAALRAKPSDPAGA
ncbi:MAG TPA: signal recognition particle subunit SRP19/SEC65 family protein [Thermoplasmata archaeon]|nr:signal recognition particle subunit SRP19/SEC65 family protein [Thermoplasmata archaeon]